MAEETSAACGFTELSVTVWERSTYRQPDWWQSSFWAPERAVSTRERASAAPSSKASAEAQTGGFSGRPSSAERERIAARGGDTSPHPGGRAQPGDVVGIETGGERTHIGDTKESENERRRDAEKDASKQRRD